VQRERREVPGRDAAAGDRDAGQQPEQGGERHGHDLDGDRRGLGQDEPRPRDRVGEDEAEDPALLLAGRGADGADDRGRADDQRAVDRADLAAHPALDRPVVGAAEQVGDALGQVELADRVAHRREQRADHDDDREHAGGGERDRHRAQAQRQQEHRPAHDAVPSSR
jgi:hypothetical protein